MMTKFVNLIEAAALLHARVVCAHVGMQCCRRVCACDKTRATCHEEPVDATCNILRMGWVTSTRQAHHRQLPHPPLQILMCGYELSQKGADANARLMCLRHFERVD